MEFIRRIYENGKITIPKELRELHGIQNGDFIRIEIRAVIPARKPEDADALPAPGEAPPRAAELSGVE